MDKKNRTIEELLVDYADALRQGSIPTFLKSITRQEAAQISSGKDFWQAAQMARDINEAGFAEKAVKPNVSLFISRVDAEIASRIKKAKAPSPRKRSSEKSSDLERT